MCRHKSDQASGFHPGQRQPPGHSVHDSHLLWPHPPHHPAPPRSYSFRRTSQTRIKIQNRGTRWGGNRETRSQTSLSFCPRLLSVVPPAQVEEEGQGQVMQVLAVSSKYPVGKRMALGMSRGGQNGQHTCWNCLSYLPLSPHGSFYLDHLCYL